MTVYRYIPTLTLPTIADWNFHSPQMQEKLSLSARLRHWARRLKRDGLSLWFAGKHPQTPRLVKLLCIVVVAYALSPIDLIPDFIPVLGYLDDLILLPALIWIVIRLIPPPVMAESRRQAEAWLIRMGQKPRSKLGLAMVLGFWFLVICLSWRLLDPTRPG